MASGIRGVRHLVQLGFLVLVAGESAWAANLVTNPSFEIDGVPDNLFVVGTPIGWTGVGGGADILDAGYSLGTASDGQHFVDLIGGSSGGAGGPFPSGMEQTLSLQAGVTYVLSFDYQGDSSARWLDFSLGALDSGSIDVTSMNGFAAFNGGVTTPWGTYSTTVTPGVSGNYALRFTTAGGAFGSPYLDNVSVEAVAGVVPEGDATLGCGLAVAGIAGWSWRRRRVRRA